MDVDVDEDVGADVVVVVVVVVVDDVEEGVGGTTKLLWDVKRVEHEGRVADSDPERDWVRCCGDRGSICARLFGCGCAFGS